MKKQNHRFFKIAPLVAVQCLGLASLFSSTLVQAAQPKADAFSVATPPAVPSGVTERIAKLEALLEAQSAAAAAAAAAAPSLKISPPPPEGGLGSPLNSDSDSEYEPIRVIGVINGQQIIERDGEILAIPFVPLPPGVLPPRVKRKIVAVVATATGVKPGAITIPAPLPPPVVAKVITAPLPPPVAIKVAATPVATPIAPIAPVVKPLQ